MLSGFGGTNATEAPDQGDSYVASYTGAGYTVLQVAWGGTSGGVDWELTNAPNGTNSFNIRNAACRPASLLLWAFNNSDIYSGGGKCVQGFSAGAGAVAYAMAWYGAADQTAGCLDKVELLSGPELADINQGCEINSSGVNAQYTTICQNNQFGCQGWVVEDPPGYSLEFSSDAASAVEAWSGGTGVTGPACANNQTQTTYDSSWQHISIVDLPAQNGLPSFSYKTAVAACGPNG